MKTGTHAFSAAAIRDELLFLGGVVAVLALTDHGVFKRSVLSGLALSVLIWLVLNAIVVLGAIVVRRRRHA